MRLNDLDNDALQDLGEQLKVTVKILDMGILALEKTLLQCPAEPEKLLAAKLQLEGAHTLRRHYVAAITPRKK